MVSAPKDDTIMKKRQDIRAEQVKTARDTTQEKIPPAESTASVSPQSFSPSCEPNVPGAMPSEDDRTRMSLLASVGTHHRQALGKCILNKPTLDANSPMQPLTPLAEYDARSPQIFACGVGKCRPPELGSFVACKQGKENVGKSMAKRSEKIAQGAA